MSTNTDNGSRIVERRDGFYWLDADSGAEFGPFPTHAEALEDMLALTEETIEDEESVEEMEQDLGIADWIDPDTGLPAEDGVPHIEDH